MQWFKKDGIFNVMDKAFSIIIDSHSRILKQCKDPRSYRFLGPLFTFCLQNVKKGFRWPPSCIAGNAKALSILSAKCKEGVAIETPIPI